MRDRLDELVLEGRDSCDVSRALAFGDDPILAPWPVDEAEMDEEVRHLSGRFFTIFWCMGDSAWGADDGSNVVVDKGTMALLAVLAEAHGDVCCWRFWC